MVKVYCKDCGGYFDTTLSKWKKGEDVCSCKQSMIKKVKGDNKDETKN